MALDRPDPVDNRKGPCGETNYFQELLVPIAEKDTVEVSHVLNPRTTNDDQRRQWQAIQGLQQRICVVERAEEPVVRVWGRLSSRPR